MLPESRAELRVHTYGRFVQEHQRRFIYHGAGQRRAMLHPSAQMPDQVVLPLPKSDHIQGLFLPVQRLIGLHAVQLGEELDVLVHG